MASSFHPSGSPSSSSSSSLVPLPVPAPSISLPGWYPPLHASLLTLSYVGGFYLSRTIRHLRKDDPRVMRSRLKVASIVTALGTAATGLVLWKSQSGNTHPAIKVPQLLLALGLPLPWSVPTFLSSSLLPLHPSPWQLLTNHLLPVLLYPLGLTMLLFAGPLYVEYLDGSLPLPFSGGRRSKVVSDEDKRASSPVAKIRNWLASWWNMYGLRNFVVGPLTEELIWRSCVLSVSAFAKNASTGAPSSSRAWLILGTPLYFGIAHLHHAREVYISRGKTREAAKFAGLQATVQLAYTTVFGWYANWLWLRTGNVLAPLVSHVFCNIMGLPNPWAAAREHPQRRTAIFATHLLGIAMFASCLQPMTRPSLFGGSLYWP
ncbi:unnamed protein product [Parajaminaea phylloscopi]